MIVNHRHYAIREDDYSSSQWWIQGLILGGGARGGKSTKIGQTQCKTKGKYGDWGGGKMNSFATFLDSPGFQPSSLHSLHHILIL